MDMKIPGFLFFFFGSKVPSLLATFSQRFVKIKICFFPSKCLAPLNSRNLSVDGICAWGCLSASGVSSCCSVEWEGVRGRLRGGELQASPGGSPGCRLSLTGALILILRARWEESPPGRQSCDGQAPETQTALNLHLYQITADRCPGPVTEASHWPAELPGQ